MRDIYAVGDDKLLIVATDRLSAFDVILPDPIPGKGARTDCRRQFLVRASGTSSPTSSPASIPESVVSGEAERAQVRGRAMVVKKLKPLPIEAVVRGYLIGSGWKDYQATGAVCGIQLPAGLQMAQQLPQPLFTPSTKAAIGTHDENIDFATVKSWSATNWLAQVRDATLAPTTEAAAYAPRAASSSPTPSSSSAWTPPGTLHLIDEVLTPDSSRFWPADDLQGRHQPGELRQAVRARLSETLDWDKKAPGPMLPAEIIDKTAAKYREAF